MSVFCQGFTSLSEIERHTFVLVRRLWLFHFGAVATFLAHVACRNLPWQGLTSDPAIIHHQSAVGSSVKSVAPLSSLMTALFCSWALSIAIDETSLLIDGHHISEVN